MNENKYYCPMHKDVISDKPGDCPKCGMKLERVSGSPSPMHSMSGMKGKMEGNGKGQSHFMMMMGPAAAKDFLHRFYIVTVLLIPLAVFSQPAVKYLGIPEFALRPILEFGIATVIFYFGLVFFKHAKMEIAMRQYGMMTLVSLGIGSGYLFSAISTFIPALNIEFYLEIATLIWVLLFGHFLEAKSSSAAGDALAEVAKLLPKEAHLKKGAEVNDVELSSLKEGDVVIVKPGEKVPSDGVIVKGEGNFNESHITGESKPVAKNVESEVVAGAICMDSSFEVRLTRVGESSTIGQIQHLIASAKQTKPSAQKLADRASKWLTFSALTISILTLLIWSIVIGEAFVFAATLAITVLVIACPHALGLAIPTVSTIATRLAVKNGVFIKDLGKIEVVKGATYVVFDKTGTLTEGNFSVRKISPVISNSKFLISKQSPISNNQKYKLTREQRMVLEIVASLEANSSHMIGTSILDYAKGRELKTKSIENFKNIAGKGVSGKVGGKKYYAGNALLMNDLKIDLGKSNKTTLGTMVYVAEEGKLLGAITLGDQIKEESKSAVAELHKLGVKVAMLTGDNKAAAEPIAKKLGIDTVFAEVLPEDKYKYVKKLQDEGNIVVMAGDGVNDAPALTQANAGVAIGAGTDVAVEAGDIVLTQSNPEHLVRLIVLSRKVYRKMLENLFWAAGYNVVAIPAAAGLFIPLGFRLTPAVGALLMSLSSVIVVINAMTLRKAKLEVGT